MESKIPTRDYLAEHGEPLVEHIHHEEYKLDGIIYVCGWRSPDHKLTPKERESFDGWVVQKKGDEDENQWYGG